MSFDPETLAEQYADAGNLNARIRLHEEYGTADRRWWDWVFEGVVEAVGASPATPAAAAGPPGTTSAAVLEVGCGPGDLWAENADRVPGGWTVALTDFSPGMVGEALGATHEAGRPPEFAAVAAAEALPFPADRFDVAVANHVLYHVDREAALPELRRVLRPGGRLLATTNGEANMRELRALLDEAGEVWTSAVGGFTLQNGPEQLREQFGAVERRDRDGDLRVPDLEPLVAYVASLPGVDEAETAAFAELAADALDDGPLEVNKEQGMLVADVPE